MQDICNHIIVSIRFMSLWKTKNIVTNYNAQPHEDKVEWRNKWVQRLDNSQINKKRKGCTYNFSASCLKTGNSHHQAELLQIFPSSLSGRSTTESVGAAKGSKVETEQRKSKQQIWSVNFTQALCLNSSTKHTY